MNLGHPHPHLKARRGSVLIVVLWASVGLVSIALLFGHSMVMTYRGADNDLAGRQADQAIEGAIRYAKSLFVDAETPGAFPDVSIYEGEALTVGEATFWLLGRPEDPGSSNTREFALVDEASKFNLNAPQLTTDMLEYLPGMTEELALAILDWRDESGSGAGSGGITAGTIKHGPFESIEELAMLAGATRDILYGEDANLNGVLDANEDDGERSLPNDNSDGKLDAGIVEYLTVFSREPKTQKGGTTDRIVVDTLTTPGSLDPLIAMIVETYSDREAALRQNLVPATFTSVMDFFTRSGVQAVLSDEEFDTIAPNLAGPDPANPGEPLLVGLINVNTASQTVLEMIPGLQDKAMDLIAERLSRGIQSTGLAWAARRLTPGEIGQAGPYLTGQSYQVSADVAAVGRHGRGYRRARVVIDTSDEEKGPQTIYRRNLAPLGWALGRDIRQNLAMKKEVR